MQNEGIKKRVIRYQRKIEHIRNLIGKLKQYVDTVELKPVSEEDIIELERRLKKKLSDEYVAFLYYIGSGRLDYTLYHPSQVWEQYQSNCVLEKTNRKRDLLENIKLLSINALEEEVKKGASGICIRECKAGAIPIIEQGCVGTVLLVIRGELAETVWKGAQEGFYFISLNNSMLSNHEDLPFAAASFLTWIEDYLKQSIRFYQIKRISTHGECSIVGGDA